MTDETILILLQTFSSRRGNASERDHLQIQSPTQPQLIHQSDHLQRQHILLQIVSDFINSRSYRTVFHPKVNL